ncbi:hypothetical protein STPH1_6244 [Streptomyces sp. OM5714]|nr:hypothetical protein STPH1_6244 [Streptomyces sp. OM5714]
MPCSTARVERRRTVAAVIGEYCASHPTFPAGPAIRTSVRIRPSSDLASMSAVSPCSWAVRAMRSFIALCLSDSSAVAFVRRGRCAATRVVTPSMVRRRIAIHGVRPSPSAWHIPSSWCSKHSSSCRSRSPMGRVISSSRPGRFGCPRSAWVRWTTIS